MVGGLPETQKHRLMYQHLDWIGDFLGALAIGTVGSATLVVVTVVGLMLLHP
jgi:hypothetical protein